MKCFCLILCISLALCLFIRPLYGESIRDKSDLNQQQNYRISQDGREVTRFLHTKNMTDILRPLPNYLHVKQVTHNRDDIDVKVNGEDSAIINPGDDLLITIFFSDDYSYADAGVWVDMNDNGIWEDEIDLPVDGMEQLVDNDEEDEEPAVGVYQTTIGGDDEGPNSVSNLAMFIVVQDPVSSDVAHIFIEPVETDFSVSGTITPALPNIIVALFPQDGDEDEFYMTVTNDTGFYQIFAQEAGMYSLISFDNLGVTGGLLPDPVYEDVYISGHLTGYDFQYIDPTSFLEGYVLDENEEPVPEVEVWIDNFGLYNSTLTDDTGFYSLGLNPGETEVGLEGDGLIPDYLVPEDVNVVVDPNSTEIVDFNLYSTDATIQGTVLLDDSPVSGIEVNGYCELGWTYSESESDGTYSLAVSSYADDIEGYGVMIWDIPLGTYFEEDYYGIMSGSTDIDFHIITVSSGIEGYVYDAETNEPIDYSFLSATDGENWFNAATDDEGYYYLALPSGNYEIGCFADSYAPQFLQNISVSDELVEIDFYLEPMVENEDVTLNPNQSVLYANYPNPFNPSTEIRFQVSEIRSQSSDVTIEIFNLKGQKLKSYLMPSSSLSLNNSVTWNGTDQSGKLVSSGVYFYKLKAGNIEKIKKMVLMK